ncbi:MULTISPECIES: hydrogen peroxide-inducible genes activator [unclassified Bosea (in: a-proteobacteria)]|uniref:hydrogen peroxide-inducible genes activator n=1 Tax=unclassified Bosea (in: a-proteobacteria) TaxID=2653178 RepID=UPI000F75803F|nr:MULTISPECIES: hydrogen peroxide-inducible genes activator [unclassified Bosea (in: a-proteobacteria)]AZO76616.1 LysR family transcriptional regulator [Bosea sp. Tri-49]RXT21448.1 LysR family transcriptional regulator [Bosea sp. Tri-39]RXT31787.1 LysR family transcriptional regulator [Bosea sp. Tri-54]
MTNLTFKQLRYLEALARHGHFGRAAEACAISQPALSMQIKTLEEELGAELFERDRRQVRLTSFGEEIAQRGKDILRALDELEGYARASRNGLVAKLRIGVIPTVAPYLLPSLIGDLTRLHGGLDLHVRETLTPKLVQELNEGRLDMAIVALPVSEPSLTEVALFTESFVLVRPREDKGKPAPNREALREMRLLLLEEGHCFRDQALSFCNTKPRTVPPRDLLDASSLSTLVQMVDAGLGVTLIPEMAVAVETRSASVSVVRFGQPEPSRTIGMVWRKTSPLARQLLEISDMVRQSAGVLRQAHDASSPGSHLETSGAVAAS